jgi:hypothetical protein
MKPYGNTRKENLTCKYGCCGVGRRRRTRHIRVPKAVKRASRKRARQAAARQAAAAIASDDNFA